MSDFDTTTALAVVIPEKFHEEINKVRSLHDRACPRWPPHINLLFPFTKATNFPSIKSRLEMALANFPSFTLELTEVGYFVQGKNITVHLKPKDDAMLKKLFDMITTTIPEVKPKHDEFNAHMTLGQFKKSEKDTKLKELTATFAHLVKFTVDQVCLLSRGPDTPFKVNDEVKFNVAKVEASTNTKPAPINAL